MTFEEALLRLLTTYGKEKLVPFTGAGMNSGVAFRVAKALQL